MLPYVWVLLECLVWRTMLQAIGPEITGILLLYAVVAAILLIVHFIPTIIAQIGKHPHRGLIFVANVAVGWTGLGWVACVLWAFWKPQRIVIPVRLETTTPSNFDGSAKLKELVQMHADGLITEEEFQSKRAAILSRFT